MLSHPLVPLYNRCGMKSSEFQLLCRIGHVPSWNRYVFGTALLIDAYLKFDSQRAEPMELVAGESYLILGAAKHAGTTDYIRVSNLYTCVDLFILTYLHDVSHVLLLQVLALLPNSTYMNNESGYVIQDEPLWSNDSGYFMRPLPGFMLQTVEETPQVLYVCNMPSCVKLL